MSAPAEKITTAKLYTAETFALIRRIERYVKLGYSAERIAEICECSVILADGIKRRWGK